MAKLDDGNNQQNNTESESLVGKLPVCQQLCVVKIPYIWFNICADDCYQQKNRQIAYSLLTVIIKGKIITK